MKFIINADDFGISNDTNKAVLELASIGALSSTSVMVNMPFAPEIVELINHPRFGIGLHFNLTQGKPISHQDKVKSLVNDNGFFYPVNEFKKRIKKKLINAEHISIELDAQFQVLKQWIGDRFDHIDSHQDINKQYIVLQALCDLSKKLDQRIGLRVYNKVYISGKDLSHPSLLNVFTYGISRSVKEIFFRRRNQHLRKYFHVPDGMLITKKESTRDLLHILTKMEAIQHETGVYEVMCHPAISIEGLSETNLLSARIEEYEILKSSAFQNFINRNKLLTFSDINR